MSLNTQNNDLSESFLLFIEDKNLNPNTHSLCEEKINTFHDFGYSWCKVCNKIYCSRCSLNHLINNQIDHSPINKVFFKKEHFDFEFARESEKLNDLKKNIEILFDKSNNNLSQNEYKSLFDAFQNFLDSVKDLNIVIENYQKKIKKIIDGIKNKCQNVIPIHLKEETVRCHLKEICDKFKIIEEKYYKNDSFAPTQLKDYHDHLLFCYDEFKKFNDLIFQNKTRDCVTKEINEDFNKIKNYLINGISVIKRCKANVEKCLNDIN